MWQQIRYNLNCWFATTMSAADTRLAALLSKLVKLYTSLSISLTSSHSRSRVETLTGLADAEEKLTAQLALRLQERKKLTMASNRLKDARATNRYLKDSLRELSSSERWQKH